MREQRKVFLILFCLLASFLTAGCLLTDLINNFVVGRGEQVEKQVALTLTALAMDAPSLTPSPVDPTITATEEAEPQMSTISGSLAYPSEFLPPQRVVAFDVDDPSTFFLTEIYSGGTYTLEVQPATYYVLAYLISPEELGSTPGLAGAYSEMVLCGLTVECEDHSLIPVAVGPGESVTGIDPVDWYSPPGEANWPADPTRASTGVIRGNLGYPSEYIPPLRVVAFDVFSQDYYYVDTQRNQGSYEMTDLPPGTYHVVAYVREQGPEMAGGYSYFVSCGMTQDCNDHRLMDVNVYAGQVAENVDPIDFYVQPGEVNWPENPTE